MLPNFLIVGAARAGTGWLTANLRLHPEIYMPSIKEVHFFDRDFDKGWDYYSSFFPKSKCDGCKAVGEATPAYLYRPNVASLIKTNLPDAKIIVSLRNPIERAYSHYWYLVAKARNGGINKRVSFEEKLQLTPRLLDEGFYDAKLGKYYEVFSQRNVLVLIFEEMVADPVAHFRRIYRFLGIDDGFLSPLLWLRINSASSRLGNSKVLYFAHKGLYKILRLPALSSRIDGFNNKDPPAMNSATRAILQREYAPTITRLEEMLNRKLSIWSNRPADARI